MGAMLLLRILRKASRPWGAPTNARDLVRRRYGVSINRSPGDNGGMNA
jgi:hypothetical protein